MAAKANTSARIRLYRIGLYSWVIFNTLVLLPKAAHFWGVASYVPFTPIPNSILSFLWFLNDPKYVTYYPYIIGVQLTASIFAIASPYQRLASLAVWMTTLILDHRAWVILDGGNNLMQLLLFYAIFIKTPAETMAESFLDSFSDSLSTSFLYMSRIQVAIVYATAGLLKVTGPLWSKGVALYYTMNVPEYSNGWMGDLMSDHPSLSVIGSYCLVLFQLSFPYLVWNKNLRPYVLFIGTLFHLGIVFCMGLVSFGLAMCVSYLAFLTDESAQIFFRRISHFIHARTFLRTTGPSAQLLNTRVSK